VIEPVYGYDIYTVDLTDIESVTCLVPGYTGSSRIYDGGFIVLSAGEEIAPGDITSTDGEQIAVTIDKEGNSISVTAGATGIEEVECGTHATVIHDLAGRRLQNITAPGVYIVNGKKYIRK
jgi:hypothetical protein